MKRVLQVTLLVILAAAAFLGGRWYGKGTGSQPQAKGGRRILYYVDPMHPAYKSDKPGIAPDCGMKLEPVYAEEGGAAPAATTAIPGAVQITPEKQQLIGVRFGQAEYTSGRQSVRAVGKVTVDERRIAHVHSKTEGWIEQVFVNFTGEVVKAGQPLLTIYSPELLAAQQEYLLALKAREILGHSTIRGVASDNDSLVKAARRRLELWDLTEAQIEELERTQKPVKSVTLYSPVSGHVTARNAFPNQKITPETDLYTVADLSRVWVLANVFEYEAGLARVGQPAVVSLPYQPGKSYRTRVSYIQPQVDAATRTIQVRIELANASLALKPEMFVDVELEAGGRPRLTVPAEAVLDAGLQKTVFVDQGNGFFEPRPVEIGERIGDRIEILKGLKAGERIVTSGNFLIGSESQLKTAAAGMEGMAKQGQAAAPAPPKGHQHD